MWQAFKNDFSDFVLSPDNDNEEEETSFDNSNAGDNSLEEGDDDGISDGEEDVDCSNITDESEHGNLNESSDTTHDDDNDRDESGDYYSEGKEENDNNNNGVFGMLFNNNNNDDGEEYDEEAITPEMEALRRCELVETFMEPLLVGGDEEETEGTHSLENKDDENAANLSSVSEDDDAQSLSDEEDATDLQEIRQYLSTFHVENHTQEISQLLSPIIADDDEDDDNDNATTNHDNNNASVVEPTTQPTSTLTTPLQHHFQTLVPQKVSYTNFWTRYYFRCDALRIAQQWERRDYYDNLRTIRQREERERVMREAKDAAIHVGKTAASFFKGGLFGAEVISERVGGVVANVGHVVEDVASNVGHVVEEAATSLRVHQSKGRPPFVMAAVEDDDDEYYEEEDEGEEYEEYEEEEEELDVEEKEAGWRSNLDDENNEDNDISGDYTDRDTTEEYEDEVNFLNVSLAEEEGQEGASSSLSSSARPQHHLSPLKLESLDVVKLRQSLMHAEEQRNHMMQMVDEREEEIGRLRAVLEQSEQCTSSAVDGANDGSKSSSGDRICDLKREAEWLTNLRDARSNDSNLRDPSIDALKATIDQMKRELHFKAKGAAASDDTCKSIKASENAILDLKTKIESIKKASKNGEVSEGDDATTSSLIQAELSKQAHLNEQINKLEEKCNHIQKETQKTSQSITQCQTELKNLQQRITDEQDVKSEEPNVAQHTSLDLAASVSPTSSSMSSGVKVPMEAGTFVDGWDEE